MAIETEDYVSVLEFVREMKRRYCYTPDPAAPDWLRDTIPYLGSGLSVAPAPRQTHRAFVAGWSEIEAAMLLTAEGDFEAHVRATVMARNERALREVLLSFPRDVTGFFCVAGSWPLPVMHELFEGQTLPGREGWFATTDTFRPDRTHPVKRAAYEDIRHHWSRDVWDEATLTFGYVPFICEDGTAFCFHRKASEREESVHGLQAVDDWDSRRADSVFSAATAAALDTGRTAICTVNPSAWTDFLGMLSRIGYRRFYRVDSFVGVKRGGRSDGTR